MGRVKKAAAAFLVILLTGCGTVPEDTTLSVSDNVISENEINSMEEEPELDYEVPEISPHILINQLGYITEGTKVAIFCGEEMPEEFIVVREDTGETVFTGYLEDKGYNVANQEYNSYGDFSEVKEPGFYYLEAPLIGRSYSFRIENDLYDNVFKEACKQYYYDRCGMDLAKQFAGEMAHSACHRKEAVLIEDPSVSLDVSGGWHQDEEGAKSVLTGAEDIAVLLLSFELYGDSFTDEMGIPESGNGIPDILDEVRYEVEWLLKMQDKGAGFVYSGVSVQEPDDAGGANADGDVGDAGQNNQGEVDAFTGGQDDMAFCVETPDLESARAFAMALAKFSYLFQDYDKEFADECLKAAELAWKYAKANNNSSGEEMEKDGWEFAAATELYRASGKNSYHQYVMEYLSHEDYKEDMDEVIFLGCVTYISTRRSVKLELCEEIARTLMQQAEQIAKEAEDSVFLTEGNAEQDNNQELLTKMMYLTMIDHMITNHEYENVIESHLHYFMGRNRKAVSYIENVGGENFRFVYTNEGSASQAGMNSKLIFMLSEIVGNYH